MSAPGHPVTGRRRALLRAYHLQAGAADELLLPDGGLRPVWTRFIDHLGSLSAEALSERFARGDRYLQDAGVFYRKYDTEGSAERNWPLSHIPVIISGGEWQEMVAGLVQRAELLEAVARDLYGPNRLVAEGHLPAPLVAQNPGWLRPLVGVEPAGGHFLNFVAFELGRGPEGDWWVLGDRTEAPSGAGFALENRVASSRIFPNFYAATDIHRLAGFFRAFQAALEQGGPEGRVAILTPGPMNDAYFEHTFIARHLGLLLTEGEDLTVRRGQVMVRTVDGLHPLGVLWRRLDAATCDPVELDATSALGTPGLVEAARAGTVRMVNALGTGVLETRAFLSFLPRICRALTGADLRLPNIATWWCGQPAERAEVLARAEEMMIGSAYSTRLPFDAADGTALGGGMRGNAPDRLAELLSRDGRDLVGQEAVTLSTTPVWSGGGLVPRPMVLRVFLARTPTGWQAMPGGYARIGTGTDTAAIAMQAGGSVADVWVVSDTPVPRTGLFAAAPAGRRRADAEALPSRAADNLFWLGRYVERAEGYMRLFRAYHDRRRGSGGPNAPLEASLRSLLDLGGDPAAAAANPSIMARSFEAPLDAALACAGRVRDRFSVDGMSALQDLVHAARAMAARPMAEEEIPGQVSVLLRMLTGFSGLVHENMYRSPGWRFLSLGLSLERAGQMALLLATLGDTDAPDGALDLVLEVGDSTMAHRSRFSGVATRESVADLLALDDANPRAIFYHLNRAKAQIDALPGAGRDDGRLAPVSRLALRLHTRFAVTTPDALSAARLMGLRQGLWRLSDLISETYLR